MECPKCKKDTTVLVTNQPTRTTRERRGIILWVIFFPFMLIRFLFRLGFGRKQRYHKKTYWRCNYCNNEWDQKFE